MCSELPCLGQLHAAAVGTCKFHIPNVAAVCVCVRACCVYCGSVLCGVRVCARVVYCVCVACLTVEHRAWLICVDCERIPLEIYPHESQRLVVSRGFLFHICTQSDQKIYITCQTTSLLALLFRTPYAISFTLRSQILDSWNHSFLRRYFHNFLMQCIGWKGYETWHSMMFTFHSWARHEQCYSKMVYIICERPVV
jgi:hypothetical protein